MKGTDSSPVVSYSLVNIKAWSRGARRVMGRGLVGHATRVQSRASESRIQILLDSNGDDWGQVKGSCSSCLGRRLETTVPLEESSTSLERFSQLNLFTLKGASLYHYPIVRFTETCLTFSSQVHFYPPLSDPFNPNVLKRISEILWLKREFRPVLFYSSLPP